ncbi:4Fe-4S dicluster domain-containing protein [Burkholderia sp. MR1-5-21]
MSKWNLIIDVSECENCSNCVLAAKDEFVGNDFPGYTAPHPAHGQAIIQIDRNVRGSGHMVDATYLPRMCNHCDDAPCLKAGADGSVRKRDDGIVIFDTVKARGRRDIVASCPYGAIVWNEEQQLPQTWFFDAHLLDQGQVEPRCAAVCPTRAIEAVRASDAEMAERARRENLRVLKPDLATRPRVYYRHLDRFDRGFIGGSLSTSVDGREECVTDAEVELLKAGTLVATTRSDAFGDFRFDNLEPGSGTYAVRVQHEQYGVSEYSVDLAGSSAVLDEIRLNEANVT